MPAGVHIILDESSKNAEKLASFRGRVILAETSAPFLISGDKKIETRFGRLSIGRLEFKPQPIAPDSTDIYSINWVAVLNPPEISFTWRIGDQGILIGQSTYLPKKPPTSEKEEWEFQKAAERQAVSEMRPFSHTKILGEVIAWFRPPAVNAER
jgi:hypothetical protein